MNTPQLMRALRRGVPRNCLVNLPSVFDIPVLVALGSAAIIFIGMSALRKRNNQTSAQEESLLAARTSAEITTQCQFRGRQHTLIVHREGNVLLTKAASNECLHCFKSCSPISLEVFSSNIVGITEESHNSIRLWHMPKVSAKAGKSRRKLLKTKKIQLENCTDARAVVQLVRSNCCWGGKVEPRHLLVIINPASGPGRGPAIFSRQVAPVLQAAGITSTVVHTTHRGHATQIVLQAQPGQYSAIIAIGGDGTMYEALQGLLGRGDWEDMRHTPLVQVPGGSGNALAASTGLWDPPTAVHAVVKGATSALDIVSVVQPPGRRYFSFLSINFGLITNLDIGTEHLRWMGGTRFIVGALQQILLKRQHQARVAVLEADADVAEAEGGGAGGSTPPPGPQPGGPAGVQEGEGGVAPGGPGSCPEAAACVPPAAAATASQLAGPAFEWDKVEAAAAEGPPLRHTQEFHLLADHASLKDFTLPPGWRWLPDAPVQLFTASNLPRLDMNFLLAPDAQLDSGHINLIYSRPKSRLKGLELMNASEQGRHMHLVEQHRVVAMALEPLSSGTWLVVDGEEVPYQTIFLEVHPSLCRVMVAPPASP